MDFDSYEPLLFVQDPLSKADPKIVDAVSSGISTRRTRCGMPFDNLNTILQTIASDDFMGFVNQAYDADNGVAMRYNPRTKKREMMVAGSRNLTDWAGNVFNLVSADPFSSGRERRLTKMAVRNKINVIYGHSRGGMYVADMASPPSMQKVGLDAAMTLATNKNLLNFNEGGTGNPNSIFDGAIGRTGRANIAVDFSPEYFHKVWTVK